MNQPRTRRFEIIAFRVIDRLVPRMCLEMRSRETLHSTRCQTRLDKLPQMGKFAVARQKLNCKHQRNAYELKTFM